MTAQEIVNFLNELRGFVRIQVITICLECRDNLRSTSHKLAVNFTIKVRLLTVCFAPRPERYKEIVLSYRIATLDNVLFDEEIVVKYFIPRNVGCGTILAELVLTKLLNKPVRTYVCKYPCGVDIIQPAENLGCRSFFDSSKIECLILTV